MKNWRERDFNHDDSMLNLDFLLCVLCITDKRYALSFRPKGEIFRACLPSDGTTAIINRLTKHSRSLRDSKNRTISATNAKFAKLGVRYAQQSVPSPDVDQRIPVIPVGKVCADGADFQA
jgi:hypothetical protein